MKGTYVTASKDFQYTEQMAVRRGQVFALGGHPNDKLLVKHGLVAPLDPQPSEGDVKKLPQCGECGRQFLEEWQRDRCGRIHEEPPDVRMAEARARAHDRVMDPDRMIRVGA